jgi:hypothetical protein
MWSRRNSRACGGSNGAPPLPGWLAYFEYEPFVRHDGGDHDIFAVGLAP